LSFWSKRITYFVLGSEAFRHEIPITGNSSCIIKFILLYLHKTIKMLNMPKARGPDFGDCCFRRNWWLYGMFWFSCLQAQARNKCSSV